VSGTPGPATGGVARLVAILARLRDPEQGCPWDRAQRFETIAPYTIEEAYEVDDAIRRGDLADLRDELGDLLLQVVYHARIAEEGGHFDLEAVADGICEKLVRRHPHVFGDGAASDADAVAATWEAVKDEERRARGHGSSLDGVPRALPALDRAAKLQRRAARAGHAALLPGVDAPGAPADADALGRRLFALVAAARARGLDAEAALRAACARFEERVRAAESSRGAGGSRG
jgi:ATP diphosphatase